MAEGVLIDYSLKIHGMPLQWKSEITVWDPPCCFVDEQRRGPYRFWLHEHRFVAKDGGPWQRTLSGIVFLEDGWSINY